VEQMDEKHKGIVLEDFARPLSEASNLTLAVCKEALNHIREHTLGNTRRWHFPEKSPKFT
jgi:hypothetical protein